MRFQTCFIDPQRGLKVKSEGANEITESQLKVSGTS